VLLSGFAMETNAKPLDGQSQQIFTGLSVTGSPVRLSDMKNERTATPSLGWVLALTSVAYFMVVLDALVVVTALPRIQDDLHGGISTLQWTVNAYGIAFAAGIMLAGALGDRFGRRRVMILGLTLFTAASATCALSPTVSALIAARIVQGIGAAIVLPISLTILTTAAPPKRRDALVGVYTGLAGLAVALGPIVGGAITQGIDWHWIFWINVPVGVVTVALSTRRLPESFGTREPMDLVGVSLVTFGVVALVWALTRGGQVGWLSFETITALAGGTALLAAFVGWERRSTTPIVPLRLFANRIFAVGNAITFLMHGATFAVAFFVTQEFQFARGYSPLATGLHLFPFFAAPLFIAPVAGAMAERIGRRRLIRAGLLLQASGYTWVAVRGSLGTSWVELTAALLVASVGISMALPTVPTAVLSSVAMDEMGTASAINAMAQRFGSVFSIAIGGAVFAAFGHLGSPASVTSGMQPAVGVAAAFAVLALVASAAIPGDHARTGTAVEVPVPVQA
jgi:EmrB/QacA subfamily drug resistance transporter